MNKRDRIEARKLMIEAYKAGVLSILEKVGGDLEIMPSADDSEMTLEKPKTASTSNEIKQGIDEIVNAAKTTWLESRPENYIIASDEQVEGDIEDVCALLGQRETVRKILTVYLNGNKDSGNVYAPEITDIQQDLINSVRQFLEPVLKKIVISKAELEQKLHPKDEFEQTDQQTRIEKKQTANQWNKALNPDYKELTDEEKAARSAERIKRIQAQNAKRGSHLGTTFKPVERVSHDTALRWSSIMSAIEKPELYAASVPLKVRAKTIEEIRKQVFDNYKMSKREEIMNRKYIVNQAYSYQKNFLPAFHGIYNPLKLSKGRIKEYYNKQAAWAEKRRATDFEKLNAALEKWRKREKLTKEEKDITDSYVRYIRAKKNLENCYDGIARSCEAAIKEYKELRDGAKPFKKQSSSEGFVTDEETGEYILPASREFYPYFLEFFVRSFMLPEFAYKYGKHMSFNVDKKDEEAKKQRPLTEEEKRHLAFSKKDSFRQIKDLLKNSAQKGNEGVSKLLVHMQGSSVKGGSLWTEAFEMLSHTTNYEKWCKLIEVCAENYKTYIKEIDKMFGYLAQTAVLFDFHTPDTEGIEGYSAGDAHDLEFGKDSGVTLGDKIVK